MSTQPNSAGSAPTLMLYPSWVMGHPDIIRTVDDDGVRILRVKVCRACQCSLRNCVCGNPQAGDQPLPIIWRAGQGENTRLINFLREKKSVSPVSAPPVSANDLLVAVPQIFKMYDNWVTYKDATKEGKVPIISGTTRNASSSDPATWVSYEVACANITAKKGYANLGFVTDGERAGYLTGVDIDGCRSETGEITEWSERILTLLGPTYVEVTPSGGGLRAWVTGVIPKGENVFKLALSAGYGDKVQVEVYDDRKYFTMTGNRFRTAPSTVAPLNADTLLVLLHSLVEQYPPAGKAATASATAKTKRTQAVTFGGSVKIVAAEPDAGFKALQNAVGWTPLERRMNAMSDERFHGLTVEGGVNIYCPMPAHQPRSRDLNYTQCFGAIRDNPSVVSCFGCGWSGDLVSTVREFDGGEDGGQKTYKNNYDCARAICAEEGLNFEDYFPKAVASPAAEPTNAALAEALGYFGDMGSFDRNHAMAELQNRNHPLVVSLGASFLDGIAGGDDTDLPDSNYESPFDFLCELPYNGRSQETIKYIVGKIGVGNIVSEIESFQFEFTRPAVPNPPHDFVLDKAVGANEGWFPLGEPSLIGGPSGANKSTLIIDMLVKQRAGEDFLGHGTFSLPFLVIAADRGVNSNIRTNERLRYTASEVPTERIPVCHGAVAIRGILERIEKQENLPAIVFLEGCDLLLENANAMEHVAPFLTALQKIAAHYHIAIIASVGSAKHKVGEGYVAKRDSVFGSVAWSRMTETIAVLEFLDGNDMDCRRVLSVLLRNGAPESFNLRMEDGRMVVDNPMTGVIVDPLNYRENVWFRATGWFTAADYKAAMNISTAQAHRDIADAYTKHILKTKPKATGAAREYHWNDGNKSGSKNPLLPAATPAEVRAVGGAPEARVSTDVPDISAEPNPQTPTDTHR